MDRKPPYTTSPATFFDIMAVSNANRRTLAIIKNHSQPRSAITTLLCHYGARVRILLFRHILSSSKYTRDYFN